MSDTSYNPIVKDVPLQNRVSLKDYELRTLNDPSTSTAYAEVSAIPAAAETLIVETEAELVAAVAASEPHITLCGIIPLTAKVTIPTGSVLSMGHGSGIDTGGVRDRLEINGPIEAGDYQVFFNTLPNEKTGAEFDNNTVSSVWGLSPVVRNTLWWGPASQGGNQTDQIAIQCAIDSFPITAGNGIGANPGTVRVPMGQAYELTDTIRLNNSRLKWAGDLGTQLNFNIPAATVTDCCIDMSDNPAYNNVWDTQIIGFRISDLSPERTDLICIKSNILEERAIIQDVHIARYGSYGIWLDGGGANTGLISRVNITGPRGAQPVGIRVTGINGSLRIENCSVVNADTYIAYWFDRNGGGATTVINCHEENSTIGYLVGRDPNDGDLDLTDRDFRARVSIIDCTSNTKQAGEHCCWVTGSLSVVNIRNFKCDNSNVAAVILQDVDADSTDPNLPLLNTSGDIGIVEYKRWNRFNTSPSYNRHSDGTTGNAPAAYLAWRIHHILDLYGI